MARRDTNREEHPLNDAAPVPPLLLHVFPSFEVGGVQVRFTTLANHFGPRFRHAIVALDGNRTAADRLNPGLDVSFPDLELRHGDMLGNVPKIRHLLRRLRPDLLVTSNWGSIEWAIANRVAVVPHVHVEDGFGPQERTRQLRRRVWTRRTMLAGRTVVVPSTTLRRIAVETWKLDPARIRYVPNGIDLDHFSAATSPPASARPPTVGTVAVLRAEKNVGRLLRAFALLPPALDAHLVVIGDGPQRAELQTLAAGLGIAGRVQWPGFIRDPAPLLRSLDVFALSSDTEQMPMSLLEAMATSLPAACTDVGDVAAILPPEQRPFIVPRDDAALSGAMAALLSDQTLRRTLGQGNRARVQAGFDQRSMLAAWGELYSGR